MKSTRLFSYLILSFVFFVIQSCGDDNDDPISIEGNWIVTKWSDGSKMVEPDQIVRRHISNGSARCNGETMKYYWDSNKLHMGSSSYTVKLIDSYTMEWQGGYGHYKRVQFTKDF